MSQKCVLRTPILKNSRLDQATFSSAKEVSLAGQQYGTKESRTSTSKRRSIVSACLKAYLHNFLSMHYEKLATVVD